MSHFRISAIAVLSILVFLFTGAAYGTTNIPVGSPVYQELEYLELKGLIASAMLSSKPVSRRDARQLVFEAQESLRTRRVPASSLSQKIIERLKTEYGSEEKSRFRLSEKTAYLKASYFGRTPYFQNINNNGDSLIGGFNGRVGLSAGADFYDSVSIYLNPEYRIDEGSSNTELPLGYIDLEIGWANILAGRDSLWWGSGYNGALLVSNNAKPFDMVKFTTSHPVILPWFLGRLGLFKPTVFLARLEENRDFPSANLLGMRLDFKPTRHFQFALNRTFMFGGEGRRSLEASDWLRVFVASNSSEHETSPINGNQLASIDASYIYMNSNYPWLPLSAAKFYTEWGAEDSSGKTKTPSNRANMYGVYIDEPLFLKDTDLRVEWANTARHTLDTLEWYSHLIYRTGYTFEGRVIGHHIGGDSKDIFIRGQHYINSDLRVALEAERNWADIHSNSRKKRDWIGVDFNYAMPKSLTLSGSLGYEKEKNGFGGDTKNTVAFLKLEKAF